MSRRALIRGGLAMGAAFGVVATVHLPPIASGYSTFSWREIEILGAISDAMFPSGPVLISGRDAGVVEEVDRIVGSSFPALHAMGFRYLLRTLEWGTVVTFGTSFSRLPVEDARAVLDSWADPGLLPRRIASDVLRTVFGMAYFGNREVQRAMEWRSLCAAGTA